MARGYETPGEAYLRKNLVCIIIIAQDHGDLGIVTWSLAREIELAELPLHRLHLDVWLWQL